MKQLLFTWLICLSIISCDKKKEISSIAPVNWDRRTVNYTLDDSLDSGSTYLSVYSQIYSTTEHKTFDLTATISMRNTNREDTIFIEKAEYFNTKGKLIRTYFSKPIYLAPMETVEIVIDQRDKEGGTGANFIFDWKIKPSSNEPLFECVMVSTYLSFTTNGKRIN
ncbi:MAG: DUF3124 domain-containing protein [Candidatus Brocadiaceae bacterium]|nr:DUF3124 domain-containing protein [Candidatus Brocadiaceae bacterium]